MYRSRGGDRPVRRFLDELPENAAAKLMGAIDLLAQTGPALRRPQAAHVRGKLWELRVSLGRLEYRMPYFFLPGRNIVLVHGLAKKTQALPDREIRTAEGRMKDFEDQVGRGEVRL